MATNRHKMKFMGPAVKRLFRLIAMKRAPDPDARLIEECRISREWVMPELLPNERDVHDLCYFEYAYMSPYQRDELYLHYYNQVAKEYWPQFHPRSGSSSDQLEHDRVPGLLELNAPETRSAIRHARQYLDAKGFQYLPALRMLMSQHFAYAGTGYIPMPNQFCSTSAEHALDENDAYVRERFARPFAGEVLHPVFLANSYQGAAPQIRALDAIAGYVLNRAWNKSQALGAYLAQGVISEEEARLRFPTAMVDQAIGEGGVPMFTANGSESMVRADRPSCMGYSLDRTSPICANCHAMAECAEFTERVRLAQIDVTGTADPVTARHRADGAERKRRERRRKSPRFRAEVEGIAKALQRATGIRFTKPK